jgi:hypothetical protein
MDLSTVLSDLSASALNWSITSISDSGLTVKLGDDLNGFAAEGAFQTPEAAAVFLHRAAMKHFPTSDYAKRHPTNAL